VGEPAGTTHESDDTDDASESNAVNVATNESEPAADVEAVENEPPPSLLRLKEKGVEATGYVKGKQFFLCKDSECLIEENNISPKAKRVRQALLEQNILQKANERYILKQDYDVGTMTNAANIVLGINCNGQDKWKDVNGVRVSSKVRRLR